MRFGPILLTPAALAAGAAVGLWLWKRWGYAVREVERDVDHVAEAPPTPEPEPAGHAPIQHEEDGEGPRFHRRYRVDVAASVLTPEALVAQIQDDVQAFVPDEIATFERTEGEGRFAIGDEFHIHIAAPWDGPVRVVEVSPTHFTLATLDGHLEAGKIRFEAAEHPTEAGALRFTIESWARSRDRLVDLAYDGLGVAKAAQQGMWTFFCDRVAEACGGEKMGEIEVVTERESDDPEAADADGPDA